MPRSQITLTSLTGSYVNEVDDVVVNGNNINLSGSLILSGTLLSSGQAAFFGADTGIDSPTDKGADVFFYVSGSSGSAGGNVPGVAVFGGDVRVSGSLLVGEGTTIIDQDGIRTSNVSGPRITFEGNRITFRDADRPAGRTLNQLVDTGLEKDDSDNSIRTSRSMRISGSMVLSGALIMSGVVESKRGYSNAKFNDAMIGVNFTSNTFGNEVSFSPSSSGGGDLGIIFGRVGDDNLAFFWDDNNDEWAFATTEVNVSASMEVPVKSYTKVRAREINVESAKASLGISGSLTKLANGDDYLIAENHVRIVTQSNGSIRLGLAPEAATPGSIFYGLDGALQSDTYLSYNSQTKTLSSENMFVTGNLYSSAIIKKIKKENAPGGGVNVDIGQGEVWYFDSPTGNMGINFTNVPSAEDRMVSMTISVIQGATPRSITSAQVNGGAVTIKWKGGSPPSPSANEVSLYRFDIQRINSSWLVLGWSDSFSS